MATAFIGIDHHNNGGGFWASALVPFRDEEGKSFSLVHEACSPLYCKGGKPDGLTIRAIDKWGDSDGFYYQNFTESEVESLQRSCRDHRFSKEGMEWNEVQKWVPYAEQLYNRLTQARSVKLLNGDESSARGRSEYYEIGHPFFLLVQLDSTIHAFRTLKEETQATEAVIAFQLPWDSKDREGAPNSCENWTNNDSLLIPLAIATAAKVVFRHRATVIPLPKLLATSNSERVFDEAHLEDSYSAMLMSIYGHAYCTDTVGLSPEKLLDESYKRLKTYCKKHSYTGHEFK